MHLYQCKSFSLKGQFEGEAGSFTDFARSYKKFGLNINSDGKLEYREWAPGAKALSLVSFYSTLVPCSLESSMDGTERRIHAQETTLVCGVLSSRTTKLGSQSSSITRRSNAASLNLMGRRLTESLLGPALQDKTLRTCSLTLFIGTQQRSMCGRMRDLILLQPTEYMKLMSEW